MIPRLWYVTDGARGTANRSLADVILEAAGAGVEAVLLRQLQHANVHELSRLLRRLQPARERGLKILASRRVDLVMAYALDGAQLTADSVALTEARTLLGPNVCLGYSAHDRDEAARAERDGADYVMLSPIFDTDSKPGAAGRGLPWLAAISKDLGIPALALGGVTPARTHGILQAGAWGVAAVSAIGAAADVAHAARAFSRTLAESSSCIEASRSSPSR